MATAPILSGDIKLLASKVMDDVPNGGGGPTGVVIPDGESNAIFGDVTERARAGGSVSIRQLHLAVQTDNTSAFMDPSIIVSSPPNDASVSITLAKCDTFAKRTDIANTIENYLIQSTEWGGYLLENHVAGQRSIQLFQRPGAPTPSIGRTLVLLANEGQPSQVVQYVRVTKVEVVARQFTYNTGSGYVEYLADVATCELTDALRTDFAGSAPSRFYTREVTKTVVRDTTVADAAQFYGVTPMSALAHVGDSLLRVASVYTQLVPSARSEVVALDQRPAAQRSLVLATSPRRIEVATAPHTQRIRVGQENRSFSFVSMLKPRPAPGTVVISYMALGNWYSIYDDGAGAFEGSGVGQVIYNTGSVSMTFPAMPDAGTSIIVQWGENTAYTSRAGQAGFRAPEFAWALPQAPLKAGTVVVTWMSGGTLKTATDNGTGGFTGDAVGEINYPAGQIFLRPAAMIDAGGEFVTDYTYSTQVTEQITGVTPDAGGYALISLLQAPTPRSLTARWVTVRTVSESSGSTEAVSKAETGASTTTVVEPDPSPKGWELYLNGARANTQYIAPEDPLHFKLEKAGLVGSNEGTYTWHLFYLYDVDVGVHSDQTTLSTVLQNGATSGTFEVTTPGALSRGEFTLNLATAIMSSIGQLGIRIQSPADHTVAATTLRMFNATNATPRIPPPADTERTSAGVVAVRGMRPGGRPTGNSSVFVNVVCEPLLDPVYGWVYNPPSENYFGAAQMQWSQADLAAGEKSLPSWAGTQVTYKIWTE